VEVYDFSQSRRTVFREPLLTPARPPAEARTVAAAPEAHAPHCEINVSGEAGEGEEAGTAPVKSDGLDQDAGDDADGCRETESECANFACAHAPSLGWEAERSPEGSRKDFERTGYCSGVKR
jgi:hypothetical protein